jgi:hypothetical protein
MVRSEGCSPATGPLSFIFQVRRSKFLAVNGSNFFPAAFCCGGSGWLYSLVRGILQEGFGCVNWQHKQAEWGISSGEAAVAVRIIDLRWRRRKLRGSEVRNGAAHQADSHAVDDDDYLASGYESPRLLVAGRVRSVSTGSSASGKSDANSQYYW